MSYSGQIEQAQTTEVQEDWQRLKDSHKKELIEKGKTKLQDTDLTLFSRPRKGCHHCHGRGFVGYYTKSKTHKSDTIAWCNCVTNAFERALFGGPKIADTNRMTYGEFKDIISRCRSVYNLKEEFDEQNNVYDDNAVQGDDQEDGGARAEAEEGRDDTQASGSLEAA